MRTIAVANRKGGVGKSMTAVHVAAVLASRGVSTLLVDMDAQSTATVVLSSEEELLSGRPDLAGVITGAHALGEIVRPTSSPGLSLAPSSYAVAEALIRQRQIGRELFLRRALRQLSGYDVVVVDTPPETHIGTSAAIVAADFVLVPFVADASAINGTLCVLQMIAEARESEVNPHVRLLGVLQVRYDRRARLTGEVREHVQRSPFGDALMSTTIRANAKHDSCSGEHRTVFAAEAEQGGGERKATSDYNSAVDEMIARMEAA